jgi:hypothetical protein
MRVTKATSVKVCAVCERTLLMGEHTVRFSPDGRSSVDVCTLCQENARDLGWTREGLASAAGYDLGPRKRRHRPLWQVLLGSHDEEPEPVVAEPVLRRLSEGEISLVEAADLFNQSPFRRTVLSVAKSLGPPSVSVVPLSGVSGETVITFAWDITWYQYRVSPESAQAVQIAERGTDLDEIEPSFREWNAHVDELGRLVPELEVV